MADDDQDEAAGRIEGPAVQGGGKTVDGEYVGTEIAGSGARSGEQPRRVGDEWDDDAVDESGALDELGETSFDNVPVDEADREVPRAFEDRQDTRDD
jgi:hypothetical protein